MKFINCGHDWGLYCIEELHESPRRCCVNRCGGNWRLREGMGGRAVHPESAPHVCTLHHPTRVCQGRVISPACRSLSVFRRTTSITEFIGQTSNCNKRADSRSKAPTFGRAVGRCNDTSSGALRTVTIAVGSNEGKMIKKAAFAIKAASCATYDVCLGPRIWARFAAVLFCVQ